MNFATIHVHCIHVRMPQASTYSYETAYIQYMYTYVLYSISIMLACYKHMYFHMHEHVLVLYLHILCYIRTCTYYMCNVAPSDVK